MLHAIDHEAPAVAFQHAQVLEHTIGQFLNERNHRLIDNAPILAAAGFHRMESGPRLVMRHTGLALSVLIRLIAVRHRPLRPKSTLKLPTTVRTVSSAVNVLRSYAKRILHRRPDKLFERESVEHLSNIPGLDSANHLGKL